MVSICLDQISKFCGVWISVRKQTSTTGLPYLVTFRQDLSFHTRRRQAEKVVLGSKMNINNHTFVMADIIRVRWHNTSNISYHMTGSDRHSRFQWWFSTAAALTAYILMICVPTLIIQGSFHSYFDGTVNVRNDEIKTIQSVWRDAYLSSKLLMIINGSSE